MLVTKRIVKRGSQHCVVSEDGSKNLGCGSSKEWAEKRLQQVEFFKRQDKSLNEETIAEMLDSGALKTPKNIGQMTGYVNGHKTDELAGTNRNQHTRNREGIMDVQKGLFAMPPAQRIGEGRPNDILQMLKDIKAGKRAPQFNRCETYTAAGVMSNDAGVVLTIGEDVHQMAVQLKFAGTVVSSAEQASTGVGLEFDAEESFAEDLCAYINGHPLPGLKDVMPLEADVASFNDGVEFCFDDNSCFIVLVMNTERAPLPVSAAPVAIPTAKSMLNRDELDALYDQYHDMYSGQRIALALQSWEAEDYAQAAQLFEEARDGFQRAVSPNEWELLDEWAQAATEKV